ncbi:MAG: tetraacyldisaccharide 4'-kinase [Gammaproteobacteria bacterium]|jgi:tetraacyldisaccharide 4'-kinase|nr:tetraacyldisaccharide 4'-kinase [Gammaproteobacteria bacterium]
MRPINAYWYSQNPVAWLLLPISVIYCLLVFLRRALYKTGLLKSYKLPVPVIIVGNITVGGTGKTPLLIALTTLLQQQGCRPGIVSRGYGGTVTGERLVKESDDAHMIGDEPCLILKRTGCPLVVGRDRVAAAQLLLAKSDCNVILSDDGLQHYRMQRDVEIAIVDKNRQYGNGYCLPAGPLRETVSRLKQVDMVVSHCSDANSSVTPSHSPHFSLHFLDAINLKTDESRNIESFSVQPVHAVAGIGHPERFFKQLRKNGLEVIAHTFADHHEFTAADFVFDDDCPVLMTEKDAVKCQGLPAENLWYVPVDAGLSKGLQQQFLSSIDVLIPKEPA